MGQVGALACPACSSYCSKRTFSSPKLIICLCWCSFFTH